MTATLPLALPLARTSEGMKSGPIGLGIILILCIVCYFLFKSMSKHLKSVREDFPQQHSAPSMQAQGQTLPPAVVLQKPAAAAAAAHESPVIDPDQPDG